MEKVESVKEDITSLIAQNFGAITAHTFEQSYQDATLPIYTSGAMGILEDLIGRQKAKKEMEEIFFKNKMSVSYV